MPNIIRTNRRCVDANCNCVLLVRYVGLIRTDPTDTAHTIHWCIPTIYQLKSRSALKITSHTRNLYAPRPNACSRNGRRDKKYPSNIRHTNTIDARRASPQNSKVRHTQTIDDRRTVRIDKLTKNANLVVVKAEMSGSITPALSESSAVPIAFTRRNQTRWRTVKNSAIHHFRSM